MSSDRKNSSDTLEIKHFFDELTYTLTYLVFDKVTRDAVIIDPVLDYDQASSSVSEESIAKLIGFIKEKELKLLMVLETHAHADHISGAQSLKKIYSGIPIAIGESISKVQQVFKSVFDLPAKFPVDGSQFDRLIRDGEKFFVGSIEIEAIATPGHTPACMSYKIGNAVFVGDALFMPDYGTGRCDFPAGSAETLYRSIVNRIYTLPDETRLFTGHDYQPGGRSLKCQSTVGEQKAGNIQLNSKTTEREYVKFRIERDKTLAAPKLLLPSVQVNIDAGRLPEPRANKVSYLVLPITRKP